MQLLAPARAQQRSQYLADVIHYGASVPEHQLKIFRAAFNEIGTTAVRYAVVYYTASNMTRPSVLAQLSLPMVAVSKEGIGTNIAQLAQHGLLTLAAGANIVDTTVYNQNAKEVFIFAPQFC